MKKYIKIGLFGFLIWLIPFVISFIIFPLRETNRPLFESIMPVVLTAVVIVFSLLLITKKENKPIKEGILVGVSWFVLSLFIDLLLFLPESPMQMTLGDYMMDIGLTYVLIIIIPIGIGYSLSKP